MHLPDLLWNVTGSPAVRLGILGAYYCSRDETRGKAERMKMREQSARLIFQVLQLGKQKDPSLHVSEIFCNSGEMKAPTRRYTSYLLLIRS